MSDNVDTSPLGIERTERIAGDAAVNSKLDIVTTELQNTQASVTTEVMHRSEGDLVVQRILEGYIQDLLDGKADDFERYIEFQNSQNLNYADVRNFVSSIRTSLADEIRNLSTRLMDNLQANDARYNKLVSDVGRYLEILSDITLDSNQITLDNGELRAGAWTILSQARAWDLEIISRLNGLTSSVGDSLKDAVEEIQNQLPSTEATISKAIDELSKSPIIKNLSDLLNQSIENDTAYQNELLEQARQHANDMAQLAEDMRAEALAKAQEMEDYMAGEVTARITEVNKEVAARKEAIDLLTEDMLTRVDQDKADFQADMLVVTNRIKSAEDGLTSEMQQRKDGDTSTLNALNTYKVSNDSAITGLSTSLSSNVTKTNANTTLITGLTSRLDTAESDIESATTAAADAMSKATAAVSANSALATRVDALAASITESDGTVVDVNAFNALRAEVNTVQGVVTGLVEDVTALESSYTTVDNKVTSQGAAISTLNTKMATAENSISQSANDITLLKTDISTINAGLLTKVDSQAFSQLSSDVSELDGKYTTQAGLVTDLRGSLDTTNVNVGNAASAAQNALNTAGSKGKVIFGTSEPGVADRLSQNLWIDTTGSANTPKRWNGSEWVVVTDKVAADALVAANAATSLANTKADTTAFNSLDQKVTAVDGKANANADNLTSLNAKISVVEGELAKKADAIALNSLTTRVESEEGKSTSQGNAITSLQNTVNHETTGLSTKASSIALAVVDNKVTAVDGRVTATNTNVDSLAGRISTVENGLSVKADVSALNSIYTKAETEDVATSIAAGKIESYDATLVIGGSNLLNDTATLSNTEETYKGGKIYRQTRSAAQTDTNDFIVGLSDLDAGDYTLSFDIKSSIDVPSTASNLSYFYSPNNTIKAVTSQGYTSTNSDGRIEKKVTTTWQRIWITWTNSSAAPYKSMIINRIYGNGLDYTVDIANVKFEKGNKATAWTPANSDTQNALNANANAISQTNATVNALEGVVSSHSMSLTSLSNEMVNLNTNTTNISDAVSILSSKVDSTEDSITNQASNIVKLDVAIKASTASDNLIPNPTFDSAYDQMGYTVVPSANSEVPINCPYTFVAKLTSRDNIPNIEDIACTEGDVYEISAYVACAQGTHNFNLMVVEKDFKSGNIIGFPAGGGLVPTSVWTKRVWRWTVRDGVTFFKPMLQIDTFDNSTVWYATNWKVTNISAAAKAQSTADATANTLVSTNATVSQQGEQIIAHTESIQSAESRLANNEASIQSIQSTYATKDSVGSLAQTALKSVWQNDITKAVGDISVGGVNLLSNTAYLSASNPPQVLGGSGYFLSGLNPSYHAGTSSTGENHFVIDNVHAERYMRIQATVSNTSTLKPNSTYTFSVKIRGAAKPLGFRVIVRINGVFTDLPIKMIEYDNDVFSAHGYTFTIPSGTTDIIISLQSYSTNIGESFAIQNSSMKLEEGNVVTAWTIAQEEVQAQLVASTTAINTLDTKVGLVDGRVSAQAEQLLVLTSDNDTNKNALSVQGKVIDGVKASYMVKMETNGVIGGFGIIQEATGAMGTVTTTFGVNANNFFIGAPASNKKPFIVTTANEVVNGVTYPAGTHIDVALIANATIGTAKIADAAITNAKILDATIESAKIKSIKADKIEIGNPLVGPITPSMVTGTSLTNAANLFSGDASANGSYATYGTGTQSDTSGAETNYIQVDVGSTVSMPEVRFFFRGSTGRKTYIKLKASVDGVNWDYIMGSTTKWETIDDMPPGPGGSYSTVIVQAAFSWYGVKPYRYLRIYGNGSNISSANELVAIIGNASGTITKIGSEGILTGSITADKLSASAINTVALAAQNVTIYKDPNNPTGERMVQSGGLIQIYDANNKLRVRLGIW